MNLPILEYKVPLYMPMLLLMYRGDKYSILLIDRIRNITDEVGFSVDESVAIQIKSYTF